MKDVFQQQETTSCIVEPKSKQQKQGEENNEEMISGRILYGITFVDDTDLYRAGGRQSGEVEVYSERRGMKGRRRKLNVREQEEDGCDGEASRSRDTEGVDEFRYLELTI